MDAYQLLNIVARKLEHDMVVLVYGPIVKNNEDKCYYYARFMHSDYCTDSLDLDGKNATVEALDAAGKLKSNDAVYEEIVKQVYKTLVGNGTVSDGKRSLDSSMVPDFMIGCVLSGYA